MARTYTDEQREYFIDLVGNYFLNNSNPSIRKCIKYLNDNDIDLSIPTVKNYLFLFQKNYPQHADKILKIINDNKVKSYHDENIRKRIIKEGMLYVDGISVKEISETVKISEDTVYKDLKRLENIDYKLYEKVKLLLIKNSLLNLNEGNDTYLNQERNIDGTFK